MIDPHHARLAAALVAGDPTGTASAELRRAGAAAVPAIVAAYETAGRWQARAALIVAATRVARESPEAVALGQRALADPARIVRYRACGLLAYALDRASVPALAPLLAHSDPATRADAAAAIAAIRCRSHHRFIDRDDSGQVFWEVNPGDGDDESPAPRARAAWRRFWRYLTSR